MGPGLLSSSLACAIWSLDFFFLFFLSSPSLRDGWRGGKRGEGRRLKKEEGSGTRYRDEIPFSCSFAPPPPPGARARRWSSKLPAPGGGRWRIRLSAIRWNSGEKGGKRRCGCVYEVCKEKACEGGGGGGQRGDYEQAATRREGKQKPSVCVGRDTHPLLLIVKKKVWTTIVEIRFRSLRSGSGGRERVVEGEGGDSMSLERERERVVAGARGLSGRSKSSEEASSSAPDAVSLSFCRWLRRNDVRCFPDMCVCGCRLTIIVE